MESLAPHETSTSRWKLLGGLVLVAAGFAAYANSFSVPFLLDDTVSLVENPSLRHLWPLSDVLSPPEDTGVGGRPLANLSFALNYAAGGIAVRGYHLVNLGIHLLAALVLFGLLRRILAERTLAHLVPEDIRAPLALVVALGWLLHPLQTEAVTYLSQRTESLMGLCYLLTLYALIRLAETPSSRWFAVAVIACACGMATKEVMVTAPLMAFLFDRTFVAGSFRAAWRLRRWLYLGLASTWIILVFHLSGITHRGVTYETVTWWRYALIECGALLHYLRLAVWPSPLIFDYGPELPATVSDLIGPAVVIGALIALVAVALWRRPMVGFVGAWFFLLLAPTSSFIPIAGQPMAEHRMYLPLAALIAAVAFAAGARWGRNALLALAALAALGSFLTHQRNADYQTAASLWRDTLAKRPNNSRAHAALGEVLLRQNELPAAIAELNTALTLDSNDAKAHNNLATVLQDTGHVDEAIAHYRASTRLEPNVASTHYNLGNALLGLGRTAEAIIALARAVALAPTLAVAHGGLGNALVAAGRAPEAVAHYQEALRLDPNLAPVHFAFANLLAGANRFADAIPHYEATLLAYPDSPDVHFNLGTMLALTGHTSDAISHYETTLRLKPDFAAARENLAKLRALDPSATKP